jgi:hypothetical protein
VAFKHHIIPFNRELKLSFPQHALICFYKNHPGHGLSAQYTNRLKFHPSLG